LVWRNSRLRVPDRRRADAFHGPRERELEDQALQPI
jgi:hypothetical protein